MKKTKGIVIKEADLDWEGWEDAELHAKSPVRWKLLLTGTRSASDGLSAGVAEIPPGASLLLHHHGPEELYYVLEGEARTEIDGKAFQVGAGSAVFLPRNALHRTTNTGTGPFKFLFVFPTDTFEEVEYLFDE